MNISRCFAVLLLVAPLAIGCAESALPTSPSAIGSASVPGSSTLTAEQLTGTWNIVSVQPAGQSDQAAPAGATYTLTFADGRLSTRTDCNMCNGAFAVSGRTLTAGPNLACTRAACPTMAFENVYTTLLSGDSTITMSGTTLVLSSARGTVRLTR